MNEHDKPTQTSRIAEDYGASVNRIYDSISETMAEFGYSPPPPDVAELFKEAIAKAIR